MTDARAALDGLWTGLGLPADCLGWIGFRCADPVLPSSFRVGSAAGALIGACALAAAEIHRRRTGVAQRIAVDLFHAAAEFRSERYLRLGDAPPPELWDPLAGAYRAADGWVRVHTNFAHHRAALLELLGCAPTRRR